MLATAVACLAVLYFSIPMADTQQTKFDVILVLGNPAADNGSIAPLAQSRVVEGYPAVSRRSRAADHDDRRRSAQPICRVAGDDAICPLPGCARDRTLYRRTIANTIQNAYYSYRIMQVEGGHQR